MLLFLIYLMYMRGLPEPLTTASPLAPRIASTAPAPLIFDRIILGDVWTNNKIRA